MAVPRLVKVAPVASIAFGVAQQADSCFSVSSTGVTNEVGLWISLESAVFVLSCLLPFDWFLATFEPFVGDFMLRDNIVTRMFKLGLDFMRQ